jgi:hypothetical protein
MMPDRLLRRTTNYVHAITVRISSRIRQISEIRRLFVIVACLEASLSCDDATKVINPDARRVISPAGTGKISHVESAPLAPFTVSLVTTGDFKPGHPMKVRAVVQGLLDTRDVEIRIVAPEVAAARAGQWREMLRDEGVPTPPEGSWHTSVTAGSRFEREISLTILKPGYYFVLLSAFRKSDEGPLLGGRLVSDQAHAVAWLWIAESGGRKTPKFDSSIIPKGFQTQPGILCAQRGPSCSRSSRTGLRSRVQSTTGPGLRSTVQSTTGPGLRSTVQSTARPARDWSDDEPPFPFPPLPYPPYPNPPTYCHNFRFIVRYYNETTHTDDPLPEAYVYVDGYNDDWSQAYSQVGYTDANGVTSYFWCIPGQSGFYQAQVWTYREGKLQVIPVSAVSQITGSMEDAGSMDAWPIWNDDCDRCHVFKNMILTFNESLSRFGRSRSFMRIDLTGSPPDYSSYCPTHNYLGCEDDDYVRIQSVPNTPYGDQIWGIGGSFTQAHEYGHAFHAKALSGYSAACGEHELFTSYPPLECAFEEGFATYFAVFLRGSATGYWEGFVEHADQANWIGTDGSLIEGAIAGFLYDLTDANSFGVESHDLVQYPGSYVADVISGCSVQLASSEWIPNRGIDHLVYCFQRDMDGVANYFTSRDPKPVAQNQSSGISNPAEVKRLWRKNLYKETI